jgi:hypothetical protein
LAGKTDKGVEKGEEMTTISNSKEVITLINVFTVEPEKSGKQESASAVVFRS